MLDIISGRRSVAESAAEHGVSRQTVYNWRDAFVAAGTAGLTDAAAPAAGAAAAPAVAADVGPAVAGIVERLRVLRGGSELDIDVLEAIRTGAALPIGRFCELVGIPRRTYHARRASSGPAAPPADRLAVAIGRLRTAHPDWGARRIWRHLADAGGPAVSLATVKRALTREP